MGLRATRLGLTGLPWNSLSAMSSWTRTSHGDLRALGREEGGDRKSKLWSGLIGDRQLTAGRLAAPPF